MNGTDPRILLSCVCSLAALLFPLLGTAENSGQEETPPALVSYKGRTIAQTMHWEGAEWLLRKEREREESAEEMLDALQLQPGSRVCDLGAGNGYHSLRIAGRIGDAGTVVAVDIQKEMLRMLEARARDEGIANIETIVGKLHDPCLPPESMDLILLVDVYHEFSHPLHMLEGIRKGLKPEGQLVLVEFRLEDPKVPIKPLHKMSKAQVLRELEPNGFKLVREYDRLPWQHMLFFKRAPLPTDVR